ncbi:ATP-binding protein [Kribbella sp. NBC_01505]|uniref:ATP-binding protein n=1 Tax=Kribbella sp. NBC_01505 TaxID=2903580 RepID=UPI00386DBCB1
MPLIERIESALDKGVDATKFERTAIALLESRYPSISPVEAGKDGGRDADIYNVIADDPDSRGRVLATTGDPLANLKSSHQSWQKQPGFRVDKIVMAHSKNLTATTRAKMDKYCETQDPPLPLPEYFARDWLVRELIRNADWREYLTGVAGRMDSLISAPYAVDWQNRPLVGRDRELNQLRSAVQQGDDILLAGVPGVGKSRLLQELHRDTSLLFAVPEARQYLAGDLLEVIPSCVVVDDAHLHQDVLVELIRLRRQEGLTFSILASAWPDQAEAAAEKMPGCRQILVDLMSRGDIDAVVQSAGVKGFHARRLVLDQADGRPGWAIQLCRALIDGDGERVVSGDHLLEKVDRYLRVATDSAAALDAVACIAALDGADQDDLERLSELVRMPLASLMEAVHTVATRGVMELRANRWALAPALRLPLVSRWFFGARQFRSWKSLHTEFPDAEQILVETMLSAAATSADVRTAADHWARSAGAPVTWTGGTLMQMQLYAQTSRQAGDLACRGARVVLSTTREVEKSPWGTTFDPLGDGAREVLLTSMRTWLNTEAIHGVLDMSIDPSTPPSSDKPLEELGKLTRYLDPDRGSFFEIRSAVLKDAIDWTKLDARPRWEVCAEMIAYCFDPSVEGLWTDPVGSGAITVANGVESPFRLRELVSLWDQADVFLSSHTSRPSAEAIGHLIRLFGEWLRLAGGHANGATAPSDEQVAVGADGAWRILETVLPLLDSHAGLAVRLQRELDLAERWDLRPPDHLPPVVLDQDLLLFVGRSDLDDPIENWRQRQASQRRTVAGSIVALGPEAGTVRFVQLAILAAEVSQNEPTQMVARTVIDLAADPAAWIGPAIDFRSADLLVNALWAVRQHAEAVDVAAVSRAYEDPPLRNAVIAACLGVGGMDDLAVLTVAQLQPSDAWHLDYLYTRSAADAVLLGLLEHQVVDIRAGASLAFNVGTGDGVDLPEDWVPAWDAAFLEASPSTLHGNQEWRLREMLKALTQTQPATCARWYERRLQEDKRLIRFRSPQAGDLDGIPSQLPQPQREQLARLTARLGFIGYGLLPGLLGTDTELAARLLEDGTLEGIRALDILTGRLDDGIEIFGPLLLAHGIPADQIARRISSQRSWVGEESDSIRSDIAWLREMQRRTSTLSQVGDLAIDRLSSELETTLKEEAERARRGQL